MKPAMSLILLIHAAPAVAVDFHLDKDGIGPIDISMKIEVRDDREQLETFPKQKAEVTVTAVNDSGKPIGYARLCVQAKWRSKGCDFELWTNQIWLPGEELTWNVRHNAPRGIAEAVIMLTRLKVAGLPRTESNNWPAHDPRINTVRKIYVEPLEGNAGAVVRDQMIALITNGGWFTAVDDPLLADATIKGRSEFPEDPKPTTFSQVGIYGIMTSPGAVKPVVPDPASLVLRLTLPSGDVIWAWDDTKNCKQTKTRCAVTDLAHTID